MAFQDYKPWLGFVRSPWIGMDNFARIFQYHESTQAIINTIIIAVMKIAAGIIVPIIMAILLNEIRSVGLKKGIQTLVYLPHFLSWVTIAGIMLDVLGLDGGVNHVLSAIGIEADSFLGGSRLLQANGCYQRFVEKFWFRHDCLFGGHHWN